MSLSIPVLMRSEFLASRLEKPYVFILGPLFNSPDPVVIVWVHFDGPESVAYLITVIVFVLMSCTSHYPVVMFEA